MNDKDLKNIWLEFTAKNENSISNNKFSSEQRIHFDVIKLISSMKPIKIFTLLTGILWAGSGSLLLAYLYKTAYTEVNKFFLFTAAAQIGLTAIATIIYLYQIITIYKIDLSKPIIQAQSSLANLRITSLWVARVLFLQLPLWTCFWWNAEMFIEWNLIQIAIPVIVTLIFTLISIWLFCNLKIENRNKKWFGIIFSGREWTPLIKSMEMLDKISEFKKE
jgi:hypothetical protein